jgi:hypothetical protein
MVESRRYPQSCNQPPGMLARRFANGALDPQPIPHGRDFAERHPGLRHAERAGVHAKEQHAFRSRTELSHVGRIWAPRIVQGIIDMGDRSLESQLVGFPAQSPCGRDERLRSGCSSHGATASLCERAVDVTAVADAGRFPWGGAVGASSGGGFRFPARRQSSAARPTRRSPALPPCLPAWSAASQ